MGYAENKARSKILTIGTTMTDQSGAAATDINIIVAKMNQTGMMPQTSKQGFYADMSEIPTNLRDMLELSNSMEQNRNSLPDALRHLSTAELLDTPPQRLQEMMTEQTRYYDRVAKLPAHLKNLPRQDVLRLTDEQLTSMIPTPQPAAKPEEKK